MFLGQEVHYYLVYIAYFTELNLQICDYAQKQRICRENCEYGIEGNSAMNRATPTPTKALSCQCVCGDSITLILMVIKAS